MGSTEVEGTIWKLEKEQGREKGMLLFVWLATWALSLGMPCSFYYFFFFHGRDEPSRKCSLTSVFGVAL